jgi:uncharacterized protein (DUF3820 family)
MPARISHEQEELPMTEIPIEHQLLIELAQEKMPFGRYAGCPLLDLPEPYIVWFAQQGFPRGRLGEMMALLYEIKVNGLEYLFEPIKNDMT